MLTPVAHIDFGRNGNAAPLLGDGWSFPEDGFAWTTGQRSRLRLPTGRAHAGPMVLELCLNGFCMPPARAAQRLTVSLHETALGTALVADPVTLGFLVPPGQAARGVLDITLSHPDAIAPAACGPYEDTRELALCVRAARLWHVPHAAPHGDRHFAPVPFVPQPQRDAAFLAACGMKPVDLVTHFESLGHNCEFGLMQRMMDAEPLGLLRFAGLDLPDLLRGLESGFAGVDRAEDFAFSPASNEGRDEFMVYCRAHGIRFHTNIFRDGTMGMADVTTRVAFYLRFLQRHFIGTLRDAQRICVLKHPAITCREQALPILARLCAYGPNTLLYVTETPEIPPGSVVQEAGGLYHGSIDAFTPPAEAWRMNAHAWLSLCANAWLARARADEAASSIRRAGLGG